MLKTSIPEIIITILGFLILAVYLVYLTLKVRREPLKTSIGITRHLRREWVHTVMAERRDVLGVQTLRNQMMAASFLASTAILISLGLLGAVFNIDRFEKLSQALNLVGTRSESVILIKLLFLIILFFFAFFNFTLSIRYYNHAGFGISIPEKPDPLFNPEFISEILHNGSRHYSLGMRGYYLAIPLTLSLFGPTWLLLGSAVLVGVLYRIDKTP